MPAPPPKAPHDVALAFVERINAHDVAGLCSLMTDEHRFIDSLGMELGGRENMRRAWIEYFHMVPDFTIEITRAMSDGQVVALFGRSWGTFAPDGTLLEKNRWSMPSAWRAVVANQNIAEWQIYADNEPIRFLVANLHSGGGAR